MTRPGYAPVDDDECHGCQVRGRTYWAAVGWVGIPVLVRLCTRCALAVVTAGAAAKLRAVVRRHHRRYIAAAACRDRRNGK